MGGHSVRTGQVLEKYNIEEKELFCIETTMEKMLLQFDWILNYWSPDCTYRREGRHLEVPAPEWVYFIIFPPDSPFWNHNFQLFEIFFTRVIEISFAGWLRGDNTKWKFGNRESRRERPKNERRGFYPDIHHTSIFPFSTFLAQFFHQNYLSIVSAG